MEIQPGRGSEPERRGNQRSERKTGRSGPLQKITRAALNKIKRWVGMTPTYSPADSQRRSLREAPHEEREDLSELFAVQELQGRELLVGETPIIGTENLQRALVQIARSDETLRLGLDNPGRFEHLVLLPREGAATPVDILAIAHILDKLDDGFLTSPEDARDRQRLIHNDPSILECVQAVGFGDLNAFADALAQREKAITEAIAHACEDYVHDFEARIESPEGQRWASGRYEDMGNETKMRPTISLIGLESRDNSELLVSLDIKPNWVYVNEERYYQAHTLPESWKMPSKTIQVLIQDVGGDRDQMIDATLRRIRELGDFGVAYLCPERIAEDENDKVIFEGLKGVFRELQEQKYGLIDDDAEIAEWRAERGIEVDFEDPQLDSFPDFRIIAMRKAAESGKLEVTIGIQPTISYKDVHGETQTLKDPSELPEQEYTFTLNDLGDEMEAITLEQIRAVRREIY